MVTYNLTDVEACPHCLGGKRTSINRTCLCRHFISDEHYCYFDDLYSPEYAIDYLVDFFNELEKEGKLPNETKEYLKKAWQEILETECHQSYGMLSKKLL